MVAYTVPKETWVRLLKRSKYIMLYMYNKHITSLILATIYLSLLHQLIINLHKIKIKPSARLDIKLYHMYNCNN